MNRSTNKQKARGTDATASRHWIKIAWTRNQKKHRPLFFTPRLVWRPPPPILTMKSFISSRKLEANAMLANTNEAEEKTVQLHSDRMLMVTAPQFQNVYPQSPQHLYPQSPSKCISPKPPTSSSPHPFEMSIAKSPQNLYYVRKSISDPPPHLYPQPPSTCLSSIPLNISIFTPAQNIYSHSPQNLYPQTHSKYISSISLESSIPKYSQNVNHKSPSQCLSPTPSKCKTLKPDHSCST